MNFNVNVSGDIISKTIVWRKSVEVIKSELIAYDYKNITFINFLDKENSVQLIDEKKYQIKDIVQAINKDGILETKEFIVYASIVDQNDSQITCKIDNFKINESEDKIK